MLFTVQPPVLKPLVTWGFPSHPQEDAALPERGHRQQDPCASLGGGSALISPGDRSSLYESEGKVKATVRDLASPGPSSRPVPDTGRRVCRGPGLGSRAGSRRTPRASALHGGEAVPDGRGVLVNDSVNALSK